MNRRYISVQLLFNKDGSLKGQRVYAIPEPSVVSQYFHGYMPDKKEACEVGFMYQEWHGTHDILDNHPNIPELCKVVQRHFGIILLPSTGK